MTGKTQVPDGWWMVRLGDVADVVGGSTPSREVGGFWGGNIPWLVPSELTDLQGRYLTGSKESITDAGMKAAGLKLIPAGSVLLTSRATVGATAINAMPVVTNQGFQNLVVKNGANVLWLYYCVSHQRAELHKRAAGSTFVEVSRDSVRSLPILLPPLKEQRAIAAVLDSIDDSIERTDAVIAVTEQLRDSMLHELLTRGVPGWHSEWKGVPGLGMIPVDWEAERLGEVAMVRNGTTPPRKNKDYWDSGCIPFVKTGRVNDIFIQEPDEFITPKAVTDSGAVVIPEGSVLIAMIGQGKTRGMTARLGFRAAINQNFAAVFEPREGFSLDFFFAWASHNYALIRSLGQGSNQDALNCALIQRMLVPFPSKPEQRAIAEALINVDAALAQARHEEKCLQGLKDSIADALLTGRVRLMGK